LKIADGTTLDTHFLQNRNQVGAYEKECFERATRGFGWQGVSDTSVAHFHNALELCSVLYLMNACQLDRDRNIPLICFTVGFGVLILQGLTSSLEPQIMNL
jgi:hypothetical protein